ncbi:MAG: type II toxin-antitoxin system VapC family toxin [Pseudonocardia sp.]
MIDYVVDASALVDLFTVSDTPAELRRAVLTGRCAAPELIDIDAATVLRKLIHRGRLSDAEGGDALRDVRDAPIVRISHRPLLDRVWELRQNITPYDASYVALAEILDVPLLTSDTRLGRAGGHKAQIEVYPRS